MKKTKNIWWLAGGGAIFVLWLIYGVYHKSTTVIQSDMQAEVHVIPAKESEVTVEKKYIGFVKPVNDVVLHPYINGFISKVMVEGGQQVKAGDKLIMIEPAEYKAAVDAAEAAVAKAEADYSYAHDYYERIQKAGLKAVSQTETDNARAQSLSALASLKQAKAALTRAKINLGYTVIVAPIDGVIGSVPLTVGDYVSPQSELLRIVQTNPIRVVFSISDKDYLDEIKQPTMFAGEKIRIKLVDGSIYKWFGKFRYADNKIDRSTNAVAVYADFENPQRELIDNAYVTALVEKQYRGIVLPKDLVSLQPDGNFVYVAEGDIVRKHHAEILSEYGNSYILKNNFSSREKLVTDKITLRDSMQKMTVIEDEINENKDKN